MGILCIGCTRIRKKHREKENAAERMGFAWAAFLGAQSTSVRLSPGDAFGGALTEGKNLRFVSVSMQLRLLAA